MGYQTENIQIREFFGEGFPLAVYESRFWVEAWVWHRGGNTVTLRIRDVTAGVWLAPVATWTFAGAPFSIEDTRCYRDNRWIRKGFVFDIPKTDVRNIAIFIGVTAADDVGGDTEFNVDRIYLTPIRSLHLAGIVPPQNVEVMNPDWMPRAWSSYWHSAWHDDEDLTVHNGDQAECHYSYLDIEDVAGDTECPARLEVNNPLSGHVNIYSHIGRRTRERPWEFIHVLEATDPAHSTGWTTNALAPCANGQMKTSPALTSAWSVPWAYIYYFGYNFFSEGHFRILARIRDLGDPSSLRMRFNARYETTAYLFGPIWQAPNWLPEVISTKPRGNNFFFLDMGVIKMPPIDWRDGRVSSLSFAIEIQARRTTGNQVVDLDYIYLMPVEEFYTEFETQNVEFDVRRSAVIDHLDWETMCWEENQISKVAGWCPTAPFYWFTRLNPTIKPNTTNRFYFTELSGLNYYARNPVYGYCWQIVHYRESYL